ncbi:uncharacterized protein LOC111704711 isoform X2 [Eurytemora carolleeae]|uniref:uncharacterized protein LOC111704711 isoform X2 n=1 Tax=Eurytemora carolleeae TaxID=1294199 RepID=UPI000C75A3E3|nr:uncharacterized protein LOC111704711 isoform X2 [Eurytemora carolleeae]|eukprot:XP_023332802.1 uncharacterized protein LOC111704711 isoform X2 [Eurytemora affinis]
MFQYLDFSARWNLIKTFSKFLNIVEVEEEEVSPVKFSFLGQVYRHAMFTFSRTMTKSYSQSQDNGGGRSNQNSCDLPDGRVEKEESLENPKETKN